MSYRLLSLALVALLLFGCGRKNPVTEISVSDSGIAITGTVTDRENVGWNGWRGPNNNGVAAAQSLATEWNEKKNIRWRSDVPGRGHSSPTAVGDAVYLATAVESDQQQMVLCFSREDGSERWRTVLHRGNFPSKREIHSKGTNANGTVACDGKRLFIAMLNNDSIIATALDLDGEIVWQREIGKFVSKFGYAPSPILYGSLVIFAADNSGGGYIAALDGETGEIAWRVARANLSSYSSPLVAKVGGRDQLLISGCGAVTSYDPATGGQNWRTECVAEATCGTIVTTDDQIFASGGYPEQETVGLSADGALLWSQQVKAYEPSMLIVGDKLVSINDGGIAYCWIAESGDLVWKKRLGGNFSASPILVGEHIYVSNLEGETFIFRAGQQYQQIAKNSLGDDCYASPAVSDGELFLRIGNGDGPARREQLVCIAEPQESASEDVPPSDPEAVR